MSYLWSWWLYLVYIRPFTTHSITPAIQWALGIGHWHRALTFGYLPLLWTLLITHAHRLPVLVLPFVIVPWRLIFIFILLHFLLIPFLPLAKPVIAPEGSYIPEPPEALEQLAFLWSAPEAPEQLTFLRSPLEGWAFSWLLLSAPECFRDAPEPSRAWLEGGFTLT